MRLLVVIATRFRISMSRSKFDLLKEQHRQMDDASWDSCGLIGHQYNRQSQVATVS
ncbi:hypothetical protein [Streptomyces sp. NPDC055692]|uniref:hypothetical protein n=1 Tax=Streptomyces sp. NPDC055692 TaxID=3155683 RepID=UPI0034264535